MMCCLHRFKGLTESVELRAQKGCDRSLKLFAGFAVGRLSSKDLAGVCKGKHWTLEIRLRFHEPKMIVTLIGGRK